MIFPLATHASAKQFSGKRAVLAVSRIGINLQMCGSPVKIQGMKRMADTQRERELSGLIRPLYGFSDLREIGRHLEVGIGGVIGHDSMVFCEAVPSPAPQSIYHAQSIGDALFRHVPIIDQFIHQLPFIRHYMKSPGGPAIRTFDLVSVAEWGRTELWNEGLRPLGLTEQLGARIPSAGESMLGFLLNRQKRGFTTRDVATLDIIRLHLAEASAIASQWKRHDNGLTEGGSATVVLDPEARVLLRSPEAASLLVSAAGPFQSALPEIVARWARREITRHRSAALWAFPRALLRLGKGAAALTLRLCSPADGACHLLLIERDSPAAGGASGLSRLSSRERQILDWIGQGKTNAEIAVILGISLHTVKNHVKHILSILGVENRTAAALLLRSKRG